MGGMDKNVQALKAATPGAIQNAEDSYALGKAATAPPADFADDVVLRARLAEYMRQQGLMGRKSTFLTGPSGVTTPPAIKAPNLMGT